LSTDDIHYQYQDIIELNLSEKEYLVTSTLGQKYTLKMDEYVYTVNPFLIETIDSTFVSSVGAYVDQFEEMMTLISKTKKAVAVVNGTAGIQVALRLVGVKDGDEVITQALTFVATANAIAYNGASPIFLDVDLDTMGLSPNAEAKFLDENAALLKNVLRLLRGESIIAPKSQCKARSPLGFRADLGAIAKHL
jgi:histidinol-phosphate/aromatic aminotransferase/cobyric acid decarboxylase-like protein